MKELNLNLVEEKAPLYLRIARAMRTAIQRGQVLPGEPLPSTRKLASLLNCHRHTVMTALDELVAEGWINARPRQGYLVSTTLPDTFFVPGDSSAVDSPATTSPRIITTWDQDEPGYPPAMDGNHLNLRSGVADLRLFPVKEFNACLSDVLRRDPSSALGLGPVLGSEKLIREMSTYLRRVRAIADKKIIITHGSQEGIYMTGQLLLKPGDRVAMEDPGYPLARQAFKAAGAEIVPVRSDKGGMDTDHLLKLVQRQKIRLIYVTPLHQFPTTATLPANRRLHLYQIAAKYQIPILEDDYDHEYHYRSYPPSPLAANDPMGLVIYVSTLSKTLFPSVRIAFMAVPPSFVPGIRRYRNITTRPPGLINQNAIAGWIAQGGFERHLRKMRKCYEERRNTMVESLEKARDKGIPLSWSVPDGGMALWLDTNKDSGKVARQAEQQGISLLHESLFRLKPEKGTHLRLGFAHLPCDEIKQGIQRLAEIIDACKDQA